MRPLSNIHPQKDHFKYPIDALLLMNMGECCTMCERPLLADSFVWDRNKHELISGKVEHSNWNNMLLLCHNCGQEIEKSSMQDTNTDMLVYPDRQITFNLKKSSLFYYSLEEVDSVVVNDKKQAVGDTVSKKVVLIKGNSDEANRTINMFQLNSHYYDNKQNILFIPEVEENHLTDRRLDLRTQAWQRAEIFVESFKKTDNKDIIEALTTNLRNTISHGGFWSVWVTLFWQKFRDKTMMRELFAQNIENKTDRTNLKMEPSISVGQGPHNHFQALSDKWLE